MTVPSAWPDWLDAIWAKSPAKGEEVGETLAQHTWTVLCRLADLVRLRPGLPARLQMPCLWHLLFWAGFLHDWGKVATGFQTALRGGPRWGHRHEVLSLAFLDWVNDALEKEESTWLAAAIAAHHKDTDELSTLYPTGLTDEDDPIAVLMGELKRETVLGLWRWLAEVASAWMEDLALDKAGVQMPPLMPADEAVSAVIEKGAASIRHWLCRYYRLVDDLTWGSEQALRISTLLLRGYLIQADHTASAHVGPLVPSPVRREQVLRAAGLSLEDLYEHQQEADRTSGTALLIAPTGSGKTEAALLWAAHQAEAACPVARLFYTLPYQASMNAMYDRLRAMFPDQVGLLHGRSTLALYRRFMEQEYTPEEATRLARWARNLARLHVPPVRVLSPYQMLKAAYQLKGYEAMLADYAQAAFVFDEIHAYEAERLAMILETVRYLREHLDARFFVMSATLPSLVRRRLEEALGKATLIRASADLFRAFTRHRVHLLEGDLLSDTGLARVVAAFQTGQSVLVTCNTVARAQEVYRILQAQIAKAPGERIILIHGRFNGRDRLKKEQQILAATGLDQANRRPVLVVSTQVVEVSLNIDLDTLFSDPAPLEALVQRFGRVNRKGRLTNLASVYIFTEPADGQGIYKEELVKGALQVLAEYADGKSVNEGAVQDWLDTIYCDTVWTEWDRRYRRTAEEFRAAFLEPLCPFNADPSLEGAFNRLFDGLEVLPLCLEEEFNRLKQERPIEATELLVPISWGRWHQLCQARRVWTEPEEWPQVVDAPYSEELGLEFV